MKETFSSISQSLLTSMKSMFKMAPIILNPEIMNLRME